MPLERARPARGRYRQVPRGSAARPGAGWPGSRSGWAPAPRESRHPSLPGPSPPLPCPRGGRTVRGERVRCPRGPSGRRPRDGRSGPAVQEAGEERETPGLSREQCQVNLSKAGYSQRCCPPPPTQLLPSPRAQASRRDRAGAGHMPAPGPWQRAPTAPLAGGALGTPARPAPGDVPAPPGTGSARGAGTVSPLPAGAHGSAGSSRSGGGTWKDTFPSQPAPGRVTFPGSRKGGGFSAGPRGLRPGRPRESPRTRTELAGDVSQHVLTGHRDPSNSPASLSESGGTFGRDLVAPAPEEGWE